VSDALPKTPLAVAVRGYGIPANPGKPTDGDSRRSRVFHSPWALVFDTETATSVDQRFRFGHFQVRRRDKLERVGFFYEPSALDDGELRTLKMYAEKHGFMRLTRDEFIYDIFYPLAFFRNALVVGFNLPWDLSRLAVKHEPAQGKGMSGGFTFTLSEGRKWRLQIRQLANHFAFIKFGSVAGGNSKNTNHPKKKQTLRRGHFLDCHTLAHALFSRSFTLASLASYLETPTRKADVDLEGPVDDQKLAYCATDVQVTWECYLNLRQRFQGLGLPNLPITKAYTEASIGKAYLSAMGVQPWPRDLEPSVIGAILSAFYGGRAEVRIRRQIVQVQYVDALSMYPTVATLLGIWPVMTSTGVDKIDDTDNVRSWLQGLSLESLQNPHEWKGLCVLVEVEPDDDILPVRAKYGSDEEPQLTNPQRTIAANRLTSGQWPFWYSLPDVAASVLLSGKVPRIRRAWRFQKRVQQGGLRPIEIAGNPEYRVDPISDDFFKRLIDLRQSVQARQRKAEGKGSTVLARQLDGEQRALKIAANSTAYGISMEQNIERATRRERKKALPIEVEWYGPADLSGVKKMTRVEKPGSFFHPLIGVMVTGAARLILAIIELLADREGLSWAFCDTDSMALARPDGMTEARFLEKCSRVRAWFQTLNPYAVPGSILKLEDENFALDETGREIPGVLAPLYCFAISAKRYALFNMSPDGRPIIRKASIHGLGHLLPPHADGHLAADIPESKKALRELDLREWQYEVWYRIVEAALNGSSAYVMLNDLSGFNQPAVSRYGAATPKLLGWFKRYNQDKPYQDQVRPFGFMLSAKSYQKDGVYVRPVRAFEKRPELRATGWFDRETGQSLEANELQTYAEALNRYHLRPEDKFHNGDYFDSGLTQRRHVDVRGVEVIGKQADRWEEQFFLGLDEQALPKYADAEETPEQLVAAIRDGLTRHSQRAIAAEVGLDPATVRNVLGGSGPRSNASLVRLKSAVAALDDRQQTNMNQLNYLIARINTERTAGHASDADLARRIGVHRPTLVAVLERKSAPSASVIQRFRQFVSSLDEED
jgi:hypothetical protein